MYIVDTRNNISKTVSVSAYYRKIVVEKELMMNKFWFTSDTHFGCDDTLVRENRPFKSSKEFNREVSNMWSKKVHSDDILYHLGDFTNYNKSNMEVWEEGLKVVKDISCKVVLIVGNNEERVIDSIFNNSFEDFRSYCKNIGFHNVVKEYEIEIRGIRFYLNHYPSRHRDGFINLFGHTHRATGLYKPFGLCVCCDLNHFELFSEDELFRLLDDKERYWDADIDTNCR